MVEHLRIDKFAKNKAVNFEHYRWLNFMSPDGRFIRKGQNPSFDRLTDKIIDISLFIPFQMETGKTGDWKNHFSPELNARIDEWMATHLSGTDLSFVTELDKQD